MPLHLESITNKESSGIIAWILQNQLNECEDAFVTKDKLCIHCSKDIVDKVSQEKVGEYIFTIKTNLEKQANEILDVDIIFKNPSNAQIKLTEKLKPSSEANEYYNAETEEGGHFQIETVNRYLIEDDLEGKIHNVNLSAFPFKLSLYDDMKALNTELGFAEEIKVGDTDLTVAGYSETFIATSDLFKADINSDETFSFVIGKITKLQNCRIEMNNEFCDFIIAQLNTAVGNLTTVINPDRYDIEGIAKGKIIGMQADIKANFKLNDKYPKPVVAEKTKETFWDKVKSIFK
ncbi:MAG: hypothetical protein J6N52_08645 [Clostridia bacterium]|nr:hypothetical protein [Clostridia bacterium]